MTKTKIAIATWNMAYWSHKKHGAEAWTYATEELSSDILLTQESHPDYNIINRKDIEFHTVGGTRPWGSSVYSSKFEIKPIPIKSSFLGAITPAEVKIREDYSLICISLYGLFETIGTISYAIPNLHRILSDLTELLESAKTKYRIILGGDLNASLQVDEQYNIKSHKVIFDRLEAFGLHNCFDGFYDDFVQTHRHSRSKLPWQNDYLFVSNRLKSQITNCEVVVNDPVLKFSDHNPVRIELEV